MGYSNKERKRKRKGHKEKEKRKKYIKKEKEVVIGLIFLLVLFFLLREASRYKRLTITMAM